MDIDSAFHATLHTDWGIRGNGINPTQTEGEPCKDSNKRKEIKKLNPFFTAVSAITVHEARRIQEWRYAKNYQELQRRQK